MVDIQIPFVQNLKNLIREANSLFHRINYKLIIFLFSSSAGKSLALRPILPKPSARHRSHGASSSQRQSPNTSDSEFRQRLCEPPTKLHQVSLYTRQPTNSQSDSTTESSSDGSSSSSLTHVSGTDSD